MLVKKFVHEVVICAASEVIARHPRSYEREDMIFDPLHYLALLEQSPTRWTRPRRLPVGICRKDSPNYAG